MNATLTIVQPQLLVPTRAEPETTLKTKCREVAKAVDEGSIGATVEKVQALTVQYYENVKAQAAHSFASAQKVARIGFGILISTLAYVVVIDVVRHLKPLWFHEIPDGMGVAMVGVVSGVVVEFIAAAHFALYARASRQFGAFHICLERTNRYLAYKIADGMSVRREATMDSLVCTMARAPMITHRDIQEAGGGKATSPLPRPAAPAAVAVGVAS